MKRVFFGTLPGLLIGSAVLLYFSWVSGISFFRLVPPGIESSEFTPQVAVMLCQCLLTGAIAGGATYSTGRWGPAVVGSIVVGFGLGFFFVDQSDQPWGTIDALAMFLPVVFVGVFSGLAAALLRRRHRIHIAKEL
jgi:hypothetical protein